MSHAEFTPCHTPLGVSQFSFSTERPPLEFAPGSLHSRAIENEGKIDSVTLEFHLRIQHHGFLSICLIGLGVCGTSLILQFPRVRRVPLTLSARKACLRCLESCVIHLVPDCEPGADSVWCTRSLGSPLLPRCCLWVLLVAPHQVSLSPPAWDRAILGHLIS